MRVGQHQVQARFVRELLEGTAQRQSGLGETPQRRIRPHQGVDGGHVVRPFFDQRLGDGQRILLAAGLNEILRMLQAVAVAGDERHAPRQLRVQPLHGRRGLSPCQRDARVLLSAQGAVGASKQAIQARVRLLGVERFQERHGVVEALGGQQQVRQADDGRRAGAKFLGALVGGLRFLRTLALAQPFAAPQPCRHVAVVQGQRSVQGLQRGVVVRGGARQQQRAEVGPVELFGRERGGLSIDDDGALLEVVDVVGHRQLAALLAGVGALLRGIVECLQGAAKVGVDVLVWKRRQPHRRVGAGAEQRQRQRGNERRWTPAVLVQEASGRVEVSGRASAHTCVGRLRGCLRSRSECGRRGSGFAILP